MVLKCALDFLAGHMKNSLASSGACIVLSYRASYDPHRARSNVPCVLDCFSRHTKSSLASFGVHWTFLQGTYDPRRARSNVPNKCALDFLNQTHEELFGCRRDHSSDDETGDEGSDSEAEQKNCSK